MTDFKEKIRKNKTKQPTQFGFKLSEWETAWRGESNKTAEDEEIYKAGKALYEILEEIRSELKILYSRYPNKPIDELIKIYVALSNRDRAILTKSHGRNIENVKNIFSVTMSAGFSENKLTLQEIADNCVDGIENAIKNCIKKQKENKSIQYVNEPMNLMEFVTRESMLSQLYGIHESYWHAMLWGDYRFVEVYEDEKVFAIIQDKTIYEVSSTYSQIRKQRLEAHRAAMSISPEFSKLFEADKYSWIVKNGKRRTIVTKSISNAPEEIIHLNTAWRVKENFLSDEYPLDVLKSNGTSGFSVVETLNVFRCLSILSMQLTSQYPEDDSAFNTKKLLEFCPRVKKLELIKGLEKSTGYDFRKITDILGFLEYKGENNQDLWCNPILNIGNSEYAILTSSLVTPSINRVVEHWLVQLGFEVSEKGITYEDTVIKSLNMSVRNNVLIDDYDDGVCRRIKLDKSEEEIDLMIRVGNVVLIGEAKSIVTTDSPISKYRTINTLKHAAAQAQRKRDFIVNNIQEIFGTVGWRYDSKKQYEVIAFVINSSRMFVGSSIDEIPVVDEKVLTAYFSSNTIPLFSQMDRQSGEARHMSWFHLYDDFDELQKNIKTYLSSPPHIINDADDLEHKVMMIPCIHDESHKVFYSRLTPKDINPKELIKRSFLFSIRTVDDIDEQLGLMDVCI